MSKTFFTDKIIIPLVLTVFMGIISFIFFHSQDKANQAMAKAINNENNIGIINNDVNNKFESLLDKLDTYIKRNHNDIDNINLSVKELNESIQQTAQQVIEIRTRMSAYYELEKKKRGL